MKNAPSDTLAHYLNGLRARAKLSVRALAEECGYRGGSSVQRYLEDPTIDRLSLDVAARMAKALLGRGNPPITLHDLAPLIGASLTGDGAISEAAIANLLQLPSGEVISNRSSVANAEAGRMPVLGSAHASFWMQSAPTIDDVEDWLTIPFAASRPLPGQYALKIIGPSINRVALEGSYAICQEFGNGAHSVPEGKYVHAQRERRGEIEWTLKLAKWTASGLILCPNSDHKDFQEPLRLGDSDDHVTIRGIVVGWYKPA